MGWLSVRLFPMGIAILLVAAACNGKSSNPRFTPPEVERGDQAALHLVVDPNLGSEVEADFISIWLDDQLLIEGPLPFDPEEHCDFRQFSIRVASGEHHLRAESLNGVFTIDQQLSVETAAVGGLNYLNNPGESQTQGFSWSIEEVGQEEGGLIKEGRYLAIVCL